MKFRRWIPRHFSFDEVHTWTWAQYGGQEGRGWFYATYYDM